MKIKPLRDQVLVKPIDEESVTKSGIVLPDTHEKEKPEQGEVMAVGEGKLTDDGKRLLVSVKPGDRVLFTKYSPTEIKIKNKEYLIIADSDILAILQ